MQRMKIGNYGTGRTYKYVTVQKESEKKNADYQSCMAIFGLIFAVTAGYFIYKENFYYHKISGFHQIAYMTNDNSIPQGQQGIDFVEDYGFQQRVVTFQGVGVQTSEIFDREFEFQFQDKMSVSREVEFCQWKEIKHSRQRAIGYDESTNSTIYETEISYTYHLGWHQNRIDSLYFDSAVSYHNPQRDPIPPHKYYTYSLLGGKVGMDTKFIADSPIMVYYQYYIPHDEYVGDYAYQNGFTKTSEGGRWAYSEYKEEYSFLKKVGGYLLEGVIDLGISGSCTPGDIRVGFQYVQKPQTLSVIGYYTNKEIIPIKLPSGYEFLLVSNGSRNSAQIIDEYMFKYTEERFFHRLICLSILGISGIVVIYSFCQQKQLQNQQKVKEM